MRVNLVEEPDRLFSINRVEVIIYLLVIIFLLISGMNYYINYNKFTFLKNEVDNLDRELAAYLPEQQEYLDLQKQLQGFEDKKMDEMDQVEYRWSEVLRELGFVIPESMLLNNLEIDGNQMSIKGVTEGSNYLVELIENMRESPCFNGVKLIQMDRNEKINFSIKALIVGEGD